jgi:RNA polymerase sigma factor (sigma-70 family)
MATAPFTDILLHVRQIIGLRPAGELGDRQLLERFARQHDQAAFEALVRRHGPLVLGLCLRVLNNADDADDAFQATFLVLARKAASIRKQDSLGSWLYGVAYRIALKARSQVVRRQAHERRLFDMAIDDPPDEPIWRELRPVIDEELGRLPHKYRVPLVLCYLEGKTNEQAARQLGWTKGTVSGRLARARELLRGRLTRRGVTLAGAVICMSLAEHARAVVPTALVTSTVEAATSFAAGKTLAAAAISTQAAPLAKGALQTMFLTKVRLVTGFVVAAGLLGTGAGVATHQAWAGKPAAGAISEAPGSAKQASAADPVRKGDDSDRLRRELEELKAELKKANQQLDAARREALEARDEAVRQRALAVAREQQARDVAEVARANEERTRLLAEQAGSTLNLTRLCLAMHRYVSAHGHFPPAALLSKEGKPLLSWRVAILPFIGQADLYKQFKLDEPWDSDHNKRLLARMPEVFGAPHGKQQQGQGTYYQVFTGPGTLFDSRKEAGIADILDSISSTLLIVEGAQTVPWTKPADLSFEAAKPLPRLGGAFAGGFHAILADGTVRFVRPGFDDKVLRELIIRGKGKTVDVKDLNR